jgi:hypothetical protein
MTDQEVKKWINELSELYDREKPICGDRFWDCEGNCSGEFVKNPQMCVLNAKLHRWERGKIKQNKEGKEMAEKEERQEIVKVEKQSLDLPELKNRLHQHAELGQIIPEMLKYYSIQYLDRSDDKIKNISCFSKEQAEQKMKVLEAQKVQTKLVEGIRASGVNLIARTIGVQEDIEKSISTNNLELVCQKLSEGKPAVLFCLEERVVCLNGKFFKGKASTGIFVQTNQGLDRIFHNAIAKCETRARARAQASALGLPLQIAEDLEDEEQPVKVQVPTKPVEIEQAKITSPEERKKEVAGKVSQISMDKVQGNKIIQEIKTKLDITKKLTEVPEELYQRFLLELDKIQPETQE